MEQTLEQNALPSNTEHLPTGISITAAILILSPAQRFAGQNCARGLIRVCVEALLELRPVEMKRVVGVTRGCLCIRVVSERCHDDTTLRVAQTRPKDQWKVLTSG